MAARSEMNFCAMPFSDISCCLGYVSTYMQIVSDSRGTDGNQIHQSMLSVHWAMPPSLFRHGFERYKVVAEKLEACLIARLQTCTPAE